MGTVAETTLHLETAISGFDEAAAWPEEAKSYVITDQPSYQKAYAAIKTIKAMRAEIEAKRKSMKDPVLLAGRRIDQNAKEADAPLKRALDILQPKCLAYEDEQERIRREEQRRLEEEARKRAEEEALAAAEAAQAEGADEKVVDAILDAPPQAAPVVAAPRFERPKGFSAPETWRAEVVNLMDLVRAVAAGQASVNLIQANQPALNQMARAQRDKLQVPGVKAVPSRSLRTRS